jgi:hypothetical protein
MVSDVQDGGRNLKKHDFGIFQYFCVLFFTMRLYFVSNMNQEHFLSNESKMADLWTKSFSKNPRWWLKLIFSFTELKRIWPSQYI